VQKNLRDISFQSRVLTAYSFKCAICGIQLKLVDAAHIIPVHENGTDETSNGLALCTLHHRAYDKSLITVWDDYSVKTNESKINDLIMNHLNAGLENFRSNLKLIIHIPPALQDRPHKTYIRRSNKIRGWN
jgi:putative restriction endonuclease